MERLFQECKELIIEVLATSLTFLVIFAIGVGIEWSMVKIGGFFNADIASTAKMVKYGLFLFDLILFGIMMWRILMRRVRDKT